MDAAQWDQRYSEKELLWTADPNEFLVFEVGSMDPGRALDLACGGGRNAVWLASQGWSVVGVDFSPVGIDKARQLAARLDATVEWVLADVNEYKPEARYYDLVVVLYLQLPPDRLESVLQGASSALAPGGTLLIVAHHPDNIEDGFGGPQDPSILLGPEEVAAFLPALDIEKAERVTRDAHKDGETGVAIDTLVRARRL